VDPRDVDIKNFDLTKQGAGRVFGDPYEAGGVTIIPVARIRRNRSGKAAPRALGLYAVHGGEVTWHPAIDHDRVALIGVLTGFVAALLGTMAMVRRPPWPDLHGEIVK
jgi:hypothetical protein